MRQTIHCRERTRIGRTFPRERVNTDMISIFRRCYECVPVPLQNAVRCAPYAVWAGAAYRQVVAECRGIRTAPAQQVRALQERYLSQILEHATRTVPAYRDMRRDVERYSPCEALRSFPLLAKNDVQRDPERFISTDARKIPHRRATTGGSTGQQLEFLEENTMYAREMGFMHDQWARVGYRTSLRKATFRGVAFRRSRSGRFWQRNPIHNELQFSPFHMTDENLPRYVEKLASIVRPSSTGTPRRSTAWLHSCYVTN